MQYEKEILCLALSRKPPSGRCVAGREVGGGEIRGWIRPVSDRTGSEISEEERRYPDGKKARLLDIISIPMIEPRPTRYQRENHLIDAEYYWEPEGRATWQQVVDATEKVNGPLWRNGASTFHGLNDKIPEEHIGQLDHSLVLLRLPSIILRVIVESGYEGRPGRRRCRAVFTYSGLPYILSMTDPVIEDEYLPKAEGDYKLTDVAVCISLSEPILEFPQASGQFV